MINLKLTDSQARALESYLELVPYVEEIAECTDTLQDIANIVYEERHKPIGGDYLHNDFKLDKTDFDISSY